MYYPWVSMHINEYLCPWISVDIHGYPLISLDIHGYPLLSMDIQRQIQQKIAIKSSDEILYLVYWNQTVPSLVATEVFEKAGAMLAWALNDNMQSCGTVLLPTHTYKLGHLHLEEERLMNTFEAR